jgi:hypothetical protein
MKKSKLRNEDFACGKQNNISFIHLRYKHLQDIAGLDTRVVQFVPVE